MALTAQRRRQGRVHLRAAPGRAIAPRQRRHELDGRRATFVPGAPLARALAAHRHARPARRRPRRCRTSSRPMPPATASELFVTRCDSAARRRCAALPGRRPAARSMRDPDGRVLRDTPALALRADGNPWRRLDRAARRCGAAAGALAARLRRRDLGRRVAVPTGARRSSPGRCSCSSSRRRHGRRRLARGQPGAA